MASKRNKPAEEKQKVPAWIVSFSDMITLLLAFFVLLQSFAHMRDPELFEIGRGSFLSAGQSGTIGWLRTRPRNRRIRAPIAFSTPKMKRYERYLTI